MDTDDDDVTMIDIPGSSSSRSYHPSHREDLRPVPVPRPSIPSSLSSCSVIPNGFQNPPSSSKIPAGTEDGVPATNVNGRSSREASVLAQTTSNLSIDQPRPSQERLDAYLSDLELEETEPPEPSPADLRTGYCYDVRMRYHTELAPPDDRRDYHPEDPRRIFSIYREFCAAGLIYDKTLTKGPLVSKPLQQIQVREVDESEVELVHFKKHWDSMKLTQDLDSQSLIDMGVVHDSVYFSGATFKCAMLSAGGAIETARAAISGLVKNAFAIIRPPGHHAECNRPMGFCIFDNVSIATKVCQADFPEECKKVLILDWDVHHGNGIQQSFYTDPNVLYISIHVHENGNFYPSGSYGDHTHMGGGPGLGKNINIPWPTKGMGDADYIFAFQQVVMPVAYEFNPDLVMIAAGFDAAEGDQLGGCFVTPACYAHMTHMLKSLANGRLVACLEGGYNLRSIARSALAVTRTLNGDVPPRMEERRPTEQAVRTVQMVKQHVSRFWDCIFPKSNDSDDTASGDESPSEHSSPHRFDEVAHAFLTQHNKTKYGMFELPGLNMETQDHFPGQILITKNIHDNVPVLIVVHNPYIPTSYPRHLHRTKFHRHEAIAKTNLMDEKIELRDSFLAAGAEAYLNWAHKRGWCLVDLNLPYDTVCTGHAAPAHKLAEHLWFHYIEVSRSSHIFFLGIGKGIEVQTHLMRTYPHFFDHVDAVISIIPSQTHFDLSGESGVPVYGLPDHLGDENKLKYYRQSLNFVSHKHGFWIQHSQRKPKKKYGNVIKSPKVSLQPMLDEHFAAIKEWMEGRMDT